MQEYKQEANFMREVILKKYVTDELDLVSLDRFLNRIYDVAYFIGRSDAEKYNQKQEGIS